MNGLIVCAEYNTQTTRSSVPAMVTVRAKRIAINYAMFLNPIATNAVKTAQSNCWWFEELSRIVPGQRNSDPPCANISVVNESSQHLFSLLTLCIRLSQRLLAPVQQWYTTARPQSSQYSDFTRCRLQRSGQW